MGPNLFLAFQITNPELIANLRKVLYTCVEKENGLKDFIAPLETAHVTLDVFRVETENLADAKLMLQDVFDRHIKTIWKEVGKSVTFKGLDMFGKTVLFARPDQGSDFLQKVHKVFRKALEDAGIGINGYKDYNPHLTLLQVKTSKENQLKEIPKACLENMENVELGSQEVKQIQLLSISKQKDSVGYYHCEDVYNLAEKEC